MSRKNNLSILHSCLEAYELYCKPLCRELEIPQMAFDILMFLANNPDVYTAKDISRLYGFKANILSVNINKLVNEGLLERLSIEGDRRQVRLVCTKKAQPFIERGRKIHREFNRDIKAGLTEEEQKIFQHCLDVIRSNSHHMKQTKTNGKELSL